MLDDRPYMRSPSFSSAGSSATVILIVANIAIFIIQSAVEFYSSFPLARYFYLSTSGLAEGYLWQLITFQFLHGGLLHLFFNLFVIFMFGRQIEETVGSKGFLTLYLLSGVTGGLLQMALASWIPHFNHAVVGASAGGFGLVAAYAAMFPERPLTLLLFFVLPVSMPAKVLLWISIGLAVLGILVPQDNIAHAAHLGGILFGLLYVWAIRGKVWTRWPSFSPQIKRPRELVGTAASRRAMWTRPKTVATDDLPPEEFISREVDPILDKISAHGIHSLTERERKILEAARAKMAKR